jgi:ABC-type glycerol-3-phosphate transport system substrate-binding protein
MSRIVNGLAAAVLTATLSSVAVAADISWPSFQWSEPNNAPVMKALKDRFEKENPGTRIKDIVVPPTIFWDKQLADTAAGNPADVLTLYDPEIRQYIEEDVLEPLDKYYAEAGIDIANLVPTARLAQTNGKIYGVPFQVGARALFYNDSLLRNAHILPPTNVDELMNAIRMLRKPEAQQFGFMTVSKPGNHSASYIEVNAIVVGFGGGFFRGGKPTANAPETIAAMRFIKTLYDDQLIPRGMDPAAYRQLFIQGKVAMYATGSFIAGAVAAGNKDTYENLRAVPLPLPGKTTMAVTVFLGVPKASKNKDLAARFILRMLKDDIRYLIVTVGKTYPGRVGMVPANFVSENPWFTAVEASALTAKTYAPEGAEQYGAEIIKIVGNYVEEMLFRGTSAEDACNQLQKALEEFMAEKKKGSSP